jgi:beta-lactam-binding protein with PASTA domain
MLAGLGLAFFFGLAGVVYMSLQGTEVKVPEITGKDFEDSEKELAQLGLKIKKRADRYSTEKPNTVIEQLPKPGETVKTGQMILVVTSKASGDSGEKPITTPPLEEDDSDKIEELITDKPKKSKTNSNTNRKKADTTRDVAANTANSNSSTNSNKKETGANNNSSEKPNHNTQPAANRTPAAGPRTGEPKPKQPGKP